MASLQGKFALRSGKSINIRSPALQHQTLKPEEGTKIYKKRKINKKNEEQTYLQAEQVETDLESGVSTVIGSHLPENIAKFAKDMS